MSKYKDAFIDIMMAEELGLSTGDENPAKNAAITFISFMLFGFLPCKLYKPIISDSLYRCFDIRTQRIVVPNIYHTYRGFSFYTWCL